MSMQLKIFSACLGFVAIIAVLGGLAHRQSAETGRLAIDIYDHSLIGLSYVDQAEAEFLRIAAGNQSAGESGRADFQRVIDRLDVALERAGSVRTRAAGIQARALVTALLFTPAADLPARIALADHSMSRLVRNFAADGLEARDEAEDLVAHTDRLVMVEIAVAIGMALAVGWLVGRILSRPLARIVRSVGILAAGNLDHGIETSLVRRRDEVGAVARAAEVFREAMRQNLLAGQEREQAREMKAAEMRQLAELELKRIRLLSDMTQEIMIICRDGVILQVNAACSRLFGVPDDQLIGGRVLDLISEVDHRAILRCLRRREGRTDRADAHLIGPDGSLIAVEYSSNTIDYEGQAATAIMFLDLSDRKRNEARIRHLAHHDPLTDLPNRSLLQERIVDAIEAAEGSHDIPALLYLDLDRFKPVNDLLGHAAGDLLLIEVARRLKSITRLTDTVARVGGDEFVIVALIDSEESGAVLAQRLIDGFVTPFDINGHQVEIGTSVGIAMCPRDGNDQQALLHAADTALYSAKHEKRGTFRFFEPAMDLDGLARQQMETDLKLAIERRQFLLHYQPIVNCRTGKVEGFEALLRWNHPARGLVPPAEFIPVAEQTGMIVEIGQWVLETACAAASAWASPFWVAVNVSPVQFRLSDLPATVSDVLKRTGLPANRLEIEITEGVLMEDSRLAAKVLIALRQVGVTLALDDFGTGYSSLSYLHSFRFDKLKIDRSFVARLGETDEATIIVSSIVGLAHNLGLLVVAEGVETPRQAEMLRDLMCDQVQGYLLGRPMPMDHPTELAHARARALFPGGSVIAARPDVADEQMLIGKGGLDG